MSLRNTKVREEMWGVKVTVAIGTLGAVIPKLGEWIQQIPGTTSEISVQKRAILGAAKILRRTLRPLVEDIYLCSCDELATLGAP